VRRDYLLEIGCENLPSGYLTAALEQLRNHLETGLGDERINYQSMSVSGTPNRLVVHITGLDEKQETLTETITGPPLAMALSEDGSYNQAARGFARSRGVDLEDLIRVEKKKGEYIAVQKEIPGIRTGDLLLSRLPGWITGIKFPRDMRWDSSSLIFARPVRWILSRFSKEELKLKLGSLESASRTRLKPYFDEYTEVDSIDHYFSLMNKEMIILSPDKRRKAVREAVEREAAELGGRVVRDDELVDTVSNLLESPVPLVGRYDRRFLKLPRQVIIAALKGHQKYFSVEDESGTLLPFFISFADGVSENLEEIGRGNERVLQARLYDAEFYYMEDTSEPVEEMAEKLKNIVWMRGMGSLYEKSLRMEELSLWFNREWLSGSREMDAVLSRTSRLAKADLASEMVKDGKEFTRLQGYIGREYARKSGENDQVAAAIFEHYLPRFAGDRLPESEAGIIVSCADKLDNISGGFLLDLKPTGSQDPYALRRQALGVLRIMIERRIQLPLFSAVKKSLSCFDPERVERVGKEVGEVASEVCDFLEQRLSGLLRGKGYEYDPDLVSAVIAGGWESPSEAVRMVSELSGMRKRGELDAFTTAMKRIANIIPESALHAEEAVDAVAAIRDISSGRIENLPFTDELFNEEAERELFRRSVAVCTEADRLYQEGESHLIFKVLSEKIVDAVNRFFEEVMVNCDDMEVRNNRQFFLHALHRIFSHYCDYSLVQEE